MAIKPFDRYNKFVETFDDTLFASGESIQLAFGPPRLSNIGGAISAAAQLATGSTDSFARRCGFVQSFNLSQSMNLMRFFEVGSFRAFFIPGKTIPSVSLGRVYMHGPSMLRAIYAYYQDLLAPTVIPAMFPNNARIVNPHNTVIPPGFENIFLNLQSDMFRQPVGMLMYMQDSNDQTLGAVYLEQCYIQGHNMGFDSSSIVVQEQVSVQCERLVPVAVSSIALVTDALNPLNT